MNINGSKNCISAVEYGVPQGSGLGPLLLLIYLNDWTKLDLSGQVYMYIYNSNDLKLKTEIERDASRRFEFARINRL